MNSTEFRNSQLLISEILIFLIFSTFQLCDSRILSPLNLGILSTETLNDDLENALD